VQVLDYGMHETTPFLVMELRHGESLAACLEREKRLAPERTLAIITQVARALGRAHSAGIVHRDLKPDNVFLVREDDQELVKILDFGIAKTPQAQFGGMETRTGVTMGTPYYMSPEQVEGKKAVDFRTDLWAMAVIACECMTGVRPFDGSTFGELLLNICARPIAPPSSQGFLLPGFDEWFARATNRDLEQRFASAQERANSLRDVIQKGAAGAVYTPPTAGATTGGAGAAASLSSINTSQSFEVAKRSSALPWVLLVLVLLGGAVALTAFVLRPKTDGPSAAGSAAASAAAVSALPSQNVALAPAPEASTPVTPTTAKPTTRGATAALRKDTEPTPPATPAAAPAPETHTTPPAPANTGATSTSGATATKGLRCFSDPFSGQLRPAPASRADSFACRQDPFTGKYKKL
jgi:serine/threonine-protein kinase